MSFNRYVTTRDVIINQIEVADGLILAYVSTLICHNGKSRMSNKSIIPHV